mmetsp:Transcript_26201/g.38745  ORF Transcript_26201/g.38745 Transcript_26201/m.38745 type:complete len:208 (-) Transcript_26201:559-1182(-)|eukprot:CAMPEP_0194204398 /NCGR_PEP_ID=MMETSP0156-20130528/3927_1 /TAXON_ID=33649 /ORGANISM="Thalassionema nitzschioides, Strain L26-B" /LENGTH=207 /DNA_ID=CAMNT_0038930397 /DNA_START=56 /DNA_END=679 /DNA_ORIENTATION=-
MGSDNKPSYDDKSGADKPNPAFLAAGVLIPLFIGTALAATINYLDGRQTKFTKIDQLARDDLHWLYISLVVLGRCISYINFYPASFKKNLKGNIRSNPFFYQTEKGGERVVFQEEGTLGKYNRANRSIHHMIENSGAFFAAIAPVGYIFPKPVFGLVLLFGIGRILHQSGYTTGYGGHALGFIFSTLSGATMEGLALLIFLRALSFF